MARGRTISRRHWMRPVERSRHRVMSFSPSTAVRKIRLPAMIGEERLKGTAVFQRRFFAGPNSTGSPVVSDTPDPLGPRKRGQSSSAKIPPASIVAVQVSQAHLRFIVISYFAATGLPKATSLDHHRHAIATKGTQPNRLSQTRRTLSKGDGTLSTAS